MSEAAARLAEPVSAARLAEPVSAVPEDDMADAGAAVPMPAPLMPGLVPRPLRPGLVCGGGAGGGPCVEASDAGPCAEASEAGPRGRRGGAAASLADAAQPKTTLMLRNLGAEVTNEILAQELRLFGMEGRVDFLQAWVDFQTKSCTGDAYLNFFDPADARDLQKMWHGREELGGIPCSSRGHCGRNTLNVVFAHKQGFDCCIREARRKHMKDVMIMGWVHTSRQDRCRALEEKNTFELAWSPPLSPPGFWPPPGLSCVSGCVGQSAQLRTPGAGDQLGSTVC